jgi:hypothetical protein
VGKNETHARACGAIEKRRDGARLPDPDLKLLRAAGFHLHRTKRKAARRRLVNSNLMIVDQVRHKM